MDQCQNLLEMLKDSLMKSSICVYPNPNKPYTLFTDASKCAWLVVIPQEDTSIIDGKT